jgi:hypothetical protein
MHVGIIDDAKDAVVFLGAAQGIKSWSAGACSRFDWPIRAQSGGKPPHSKFILFLKMLRRDDAEDFLGAGEAAGDF